MINFKERYYAYKNKRALKALSSQVTKIKENIAAFRDKSDEELKQLFEEFKSEKDENKKIENVFALGYLVIEKLIGLSLFDVQLMSAINLYKGNISEQKTGQGKSVTGVLPALLRATEGQVHICTVNEYLAQRDKELFEPIFNFFGLTTALNLQSDPKWLKQRHYRANVLYGQGSTFGFDYLYDNMAQSLEDKLCKPEQRYFSLIDEVDLILIDEARTPLIIGAPFGKDVNKLILVDKLVKTLEETDYEVDRKNHAVYLTEAGESKLEEAFKDDFIWDDEEDKIEIMHLIHESLLANYFYQEDIDYGIIEHKGELCIVIIDTYTGRIQPDRRFSNGLHQALEAKHSDKVTIKAETKTTATITLQNYFRLYKHLSGMSGTVQEERDEFKSVYNLDVVIIPPHQEDIREDLEMILEPTKEDKWRKVTEKIKHYNSLDYPILVGTSSVEDSELISERLKLENLEHVVLNAKQDKKEAEIISLAGLRGSITVATNMAGRGTDIIPESEEHPLVVIVTELNESSRIDRQLKGRTGRQGAKGITETILSAEDLIFQRANVDKQLSKIVSISPTFKLVNKLAKSMQSELEGSSAEARKQALKYDDIIKEQRNLFYQTRDKVLSTVELENLEAILKTIELEEEYINDLIERNFFKDTKALQHFILYAMDKTWVSHIDKLDRLKSAIGYRGYSGHNPAILYQNEAQVLYDSLKERIKNNMGNILEEMKKQDIKQADAYKGEKGE